MCVCVFVIVDTNHQIYLVGTLPLFKQKLRVADTTTNEHASLSKQFKIYRAQWPSFIKYYNFIFTVQNDRVLQ